MIAITLKLRYLLLVWIIIMCACNRGPKNQTTANDTIVKEAIKINIKPLQLMADTAGKSENGFPDISGYYEEADDEQDEETTEGCNIAVTIKRDAKGFNYYLKTADKNYRGKVRLEKNTGREYGTVFEGIKYAEYKGDISKKTDSDNIQELETPVGIGGEWQRDAITIQNYGNAMNYYVQIGGCQVKFIRLIKVK